MSPKGDVVCSADLGHMFQFCAPSRRAIGVEQGWGTRMSWDAFKLHLEVVARGLVCLVFTYDGLFAHLIIYARTTCLASATFRKIHATFVKTIVNDYFKYMIRLLNKVKKIITSP